MNTRLYYYRGRLTALCFFITLHFISCGIGYVVGRAS